MRPLSRRVTGEAPFIRAKAPERALGCQRAAHGLSGGFGPLMAPARRCPPGDNVGGLSPRRMCYTLKPESL